MSSCVWYFGFPHNAMIFEFEDCRVDCEKAELSRGGKAVDVEPKVFDILVYLIGERARVVSKDDLIAAVWDGRFVSDAAVSSAIKSARAILGDSGAKQRLIKTVHGRGFRFVGQVDVTEPKEPETTGRKRDKLRHEVRYCRSTDGTRIAYAKSGTGTPILRAATWMSHLDYELESPVWAPWLSTFDGLGELVRYDVRGNGLSDRHAPISFDGFVEDLEAVVEATGLDQFVLFGMSLGAAVSIEYAARHPERIRGLIISGGYYRGWNAVSRKAPDWELREAVTELIRAGWGQNNPAFRQMFTSWLVPSATQEQMDSFNELQRRTVAPEVAAEIHKSLGFIDVKHRLEGLKMPTLVFHSRDDSSVPLDAGRAIAAGIEGARFVSLDSANHILMEDEPAFEHFSEEVALFVKGLE